MNLHINYLTALSDNYIWLIQSDSEIIVIDPGESYKLIDYIQKNQLILKAILLTHDHYDHINGVDELLSVTDVPVYGMCSIASHKLQNDDMLNLSIENGLNIHGNIIATPGHTYTSICYLMKIAGQQHLFCGDTLFAAGCGRVFTGDFRAMYDSLNQLRVLDPRCLVYPGHEYTLKNLSFAQFIEPDNDLVAQRIKNEQAKLDTHKNTLPVTIGIEQKTNPFFRCDDLILVEAVEKILDQKVEVGFDCFVKLREMRNNF